MISFLNIKQFTKNLTPITTSLSIINDTFHPEGIYSEKIFGTINSLDRRKNFSYIDLKCQVIHPTAYNILIRLDRKIEKFVSTEKSFILDENGLLTISDEKNSVTGISEFIKLFPKIRFRIESVVREKFVKLLQREYINGNLFIDKLIVIPPDFRPVYQDFQTKDWIQDSLNDVYLSIIRKTSQLKSSQIGPLFDLLNYNVQKAIIEHDKFIRTKIEKKQGLIRNQMLGKRIDFSGRAVITPNPTLNANEIGIPFRMAIALFEPFILFNLLKTKRFDQEKLSNLITELYNVPLSHETLLRTFKSIKEDDKIPDELFKMIYEATEISMRDRVVIAKRDPVLHRESYLGMIPVLHDGDTIQLNTLQTGPLNADFDGDQMAVFHLLTDEAQDEIKRKMLKITTGDSFTSLNLNLSKEMLVGLYSSTKPVTKHENEKYVDDEELKAINDPYIIVKYRNHVTTSGRAVFNSCFPLNFPFCNELVDKKVLAKQINELVKNYPPDIVKKTISCLKNVGFKWSTIIAPNLNMDDLQLPPEIYKLRKELDGATPEHAQDIIKQAEKIIQNHIHGTGLGDLSESGNSRGVSQIVQILFAKGIITDTSGNVLSPVTSSFSDGFSNVDFFKMSSGSRKGIIDRVISTADTGYMSRKLAYIANNAELSPFLNDCKTTKTLSVKLTDSLITRLKGRYIVSNGKVQLFDKNKYKVGDIIYLRSPIFCKSNKICHTCYGELLKVHTTPYIGILAAQVIGERGTQMSMKKFHTGGVVDIVKRDLLKDLEENLME